MKLWRFFVVIPVSLSAAAVARYLNINGLLKDIIIGLVAVIMMLIFNKPNSQ